MLLKYQKRKGDYYDEIIETRYGDLYGSGFGLLSGGLHRNEEKFFDNEAINFAVTDSEQFQQQRQFIQEERNRCF